MESRTLSPGTVFFGTRLRRLSEALDREVQALYRAEGVVFSPRWFAVVMALTRQGPQTVGELAAAIGITHAAVSQVRGDLIAERLVVVQTDPKDRRRQVLELSEEGRRRIATLQPFWEALAQATDALCADAAPQFLAQLDALEAALAHRPLAARVNSIRNAKAKPKQGATRHA